MKTGSPASNAPCTQEKVSIFGSQQYRSGDLTRAINQDMSYSQKKKKIKGQIPSQAINKKGNFHNPNKAIVFSRFS